MKKLISLLAILSCALMSKSQILHPVKWSYAAKKTAPGLAVVFLKATIEKGWHIYSTKQPDGGPVKTSFEFLPSQAYVLDGGIEEPTPLSKTDKTFTMQVFYFEKTVVFQQKIKLKAPNAVIKGKLNFMVCNEQKCLPPEDVVFTIPIK